MTVARNQVAAPLRLGTAAGRWVVVATVLGSSIAMIDGTVVNVALPAIGRELHAGIATLQWTVTAYALTLSGFLLLGGALGDQLGRRRVYLVGVVWFALASLLCGLAPTAPVLVAARALQGVGGALLTPGSLAIIEASFAPDDRGAAIGAWSGLSGVAAAIGPFLGGWLVAAATWRLVFFINLPLAAVVVWLASAHVPESRDPAAAPGVDAGGAALAAAGLAGVVYALIEGPERAWSWPVVAAGAGGVVALALFAVVERRSRHPMLSYEAFASTQFSVVNLITFLIYGALSGSLFLLPIQLQRVLGWSPVAAGTALVPFTVLMLLLSARVGRLAQRIGPRLPMTVGPLLAAAGLVLFARVGPGATYLGAVLPAVLVFGLGMTITVAPLTAAVLAAAPAEHAGAASGINNAVARTAGLLAVAVLPPLAGVSGPRALDPAVLTAGFRHAVLIAAGLVAAGGLVALATVRRPAAPAPTAAHATKPCCPVDAPPLRRPPAPTVKQR